MGYTYLEFNCLVLPHTFWTKYSKYLMLMNGAHNWQLCIIQDFVECVWSFIKLVQIGTEADKW